MEVRTELYLRKEMTMIFEFIKSGCFWSRRAEIWVILPLREQPPMLYIPHRRATATPKPEICLPPMVMRSAGFPILQTAISEVVDVKSWGNAHTLLTLRKTLG